MLDLATPWLLLLLPAPFVAQKLLRPATTQGGALLVPDRIGQAIANKAKPDRYRAIEKLDTWLLWIAWALMAFALAGPREVAPVSALKVSGRDLAISLDLSGSMVREDFYLDGAAISRLNAVKAVGAEFARSRVGDRVALVLFGSEAYFATPFTFDVEAVAQRIEAATIGISGRATNISDGLGLAIKRLADSKAATRVVILLSDGKNNAGATNPSGVAQLAKKLKVRVHTIAMGPKDLASAQKGERGVVDATTLQHIAQITGGESFRVKTMEDLQIVAAKLNQLETTDSEGLAAEIYHEYWIWPGMLAGVLTLLVAARRLA